jgi:hypothetical protein
MTVAATAIRGDQQTANIRVGHLSHFAPPAPDALDGEFGGIVVDTDTDPEPVLVVTS